MGKQKTQNRQSRFDKKTSRIPSRLKGILFTFICVFFLILQIVTQWSCMDTLLAICIPWMYYQFVVLGTFFLPTIVNFVRKYFCKSSNRKNHIEDSYVWEIAMLLIIVPAIIFLPNRYIPIEPEKEYRGEVIDITSAPVNKSPSSNRNYVKVRLDGEDTSFWYCLNKASKPLGSKCIVSVRKGIFGMRYVEKVDFYDDGSGLSESFQEKYEMMLNQSRI